MSNSKNVAAILGPTIVAMVASEFPLVQPHLYDTQIPPVIYLSGTLLFVGGLVVVRVHNRWKRDWTVLVTLIWVVLPLSRPVPHVCRERVPAGLRKYQRDDLNGFGGDARDSWAHHDFPGVPPRWEVEGGVARNSRPGPGWKSPQSRRGPQPPRRQFAC